VNERNKGFTLIEVIGVLAIMAILASAIAPNIVHGIKRAVRDAEDASLSTLAATLRRSVTETHVIPGTPAAEWSGAIEPYLDVPQNSISNNKGTGTRRLISRQTNDLGGVPYDQGARFSAGGAAQGTLPTAAPLRARMIFVSDLSGNPPNGNISNNRFDIIWEQVGNIPNGFQESEDVRLARISFAGMFYPVTVNCLSVANVPRWSIDAETAKSLSTGTFTVYLIEGTRVNLQIGANLQSTVVVDGTKGITYDGSVWSF